MTDTVLITGYTDFITDDFIANAFPHHRVVITGGTQVKNSSENKVSVYKGDLDEAACRKLFRMYDFEKVVFFSGGTAPFCTIDGDELEKLPVVLSHCGEDTKILYVMGNEHPSTDPASVIEFAAKEICGRSSYRTQGVNIVVSPWIYDMYAPQPALFGYFEKGLHTIPFSAGQELSFLAAEDLALLIFRMFDNWDISIEPYYVANVFVDTAEKFTLLAERELGTDDVSYEFTESRRYDLTAWKNTELRTRFMWFPVYSFFEDLPKIISHYKESKPKKAGLLDRILKKNNIIIRILELLVGYAICEFLMRITGVDIHFKMIDFRLLYVVVIGIMYDMYMGLAAALIASISLVFAYFRGGTSWLNLFYEPANWLPFIAYFTVGALCGYIRARDRDLLTFSKNETTSIQERYDYLISINEDILQEKKDYKQQIIGSRDSFGKIFKITRQLDDVNPKYILARATEIIENVMSNPSVGIYNCNCGRNFGRLAISSRGVEFPFSQMMKPFYDKLEILADGEVYVNRDLEEGMPKYMYAIRKNGEIDTVIMLKYAEYSQMTLYYENLFKVLCGLISSSLIRASDYQSVVHEAKTVKGTENVLSSEFFKEELRLALDSREKNLATHLLIRIPCAEEELAEKEKLAAKCVRNTDELGYSDGFIYVLLYQALPRDTEFILPRFSDAGLTCELLDIDAQSEFAGDER